MKVVYRVAARRDLIRHFVYFAENADTETAQRFRESLLDSCKTLARFPEMGSPVPLPDSRLAQVRMWPVRDFEKYLVFYEPIANGIRLTRILHAAQDYQRVLGDKPVP